MANEDKVNINVRTDVGPTEHTVKPLPLHSAGARVYLFNGEKTAIEVSRTEICTKPTKAKYTKIRYQQMS